MTKKNKETESFDVSSIFDNILDATEKDTQFFSQEMGLTDLDTCMSTGILALDTISGGGVKIGRAYSYTGPQHGGKTTIVKSILGQALSSIPYQRKGIYIDGEGAFDPTWAGHIWGYDPNELYKVFGQKDKNGSYIHRPQIRYYKPQFGEQALEFIKAYLFELPEKVKFDDQWWYLYTPTPAKEVKATGVGKTAAEIRELLTVKVNGKTQKLWNAALYSDRGAFYVPISNNYAGLEGVIAIDSWSSLKPKQLAKNVNEAIGAQARMFSNMLDTVKSLVSSRGYVLIGTKQIRNKIGGYGNPEINPGGENLKHVDDALFRIGTVSNKIKTGNSNYNVQVEGDDEYRYFKIRNQKNRVFTPYKETEGRWWTSHAGSSGSGIDPVYDTLQYLTMTGQKEATKKGNKKAFIVALQEDNKTAKKLRDIPFTYESFKSSILDSCLYNSEGQKVASFDLRSYCFRQVRKDDGLGLRLFLNGGIVTEDEDVDVEDDYEGEE